MSLSFKIAENKTDFARCMHIRGAVFGGDQGICVSEDIDDIEDTCRHVLGLDGDKPCAAMRWRVYKPGIVKIERYAVRKEWQGKGVGRAMMNFVLADIAAHEPGAKIILGAQNTAIPFYERLGFTTYGDEYMDANIPHHMMEKAA